MASYNEKSVNAFKVVRDSLAALKLPFARQRRYNGIVNAIEMQIEIGRRSRVVIDHLYATLLALAEHEKNRDKEIQPLEAVLDNFLTQVGHILK